MKLSPAQRETLALLKCAGDAQTARALGMPHKTMWILERSGCVEVERIDNRKRLTTGVYYRITDKGRQEAAG